MDDADRDALVRAVFSFGIAAGVVTLGSLVVRSGEMVGVNFHVYYLAAEAIVSGAELYDVAAPGFPGLPYVYPPIVAVVFLPFLVIGDWGVAFVLFTLVNIGGAMALGVAVLHIAADRGGRVTRRMQLLVVGFVVASSQMVPSLFFGNVNPLLAAGVALGVVGVDRGWPRVVGVGFGVPAVVKVFPVVFGGYVLLRERWRAVGAGLAVGVVSVVVSMVLFGVDVHVAYLNQALLPRRQAAAFVGGLAPGAELLTLRRPLSYVLPQQPALLGPVAMVVLAPVVVDVLVRVDVESGMGSLLVLHTVLVAVVLVVPSYQVYYVFVLPSLVPLLLCLPPGVGRQLVAIGAILGSITVQLPDVKLLFTDNSLLGSVVLTVLEPLLTLGTPPLYGLLLTLVGCLVVVRRHPTEDAELTAIDERGAILRRW